MQSFSESTNVVHTLSATTQPAFARMNVFYAGTGSVYCLSRTEPWWYSNPSRLPFALDDADIAVTRAERPDVRAPSEHMANIRIVFNPAISDLANLFDVSRQSIYKWLSGDSIPEPDKIARIVELSKAADLFKAGAVSRAGAMLTMKSFSGRSLLDLMKAGENRNDHVEALISEARAMDASYKRSGLASSKSKPSRDWQSSISIPGAPEHL